jgi:hypothetical protein
MLQTLLIQRGEGAALNKVVLRHCISAFSRYAS